MSVNAELADTPSIINLGTEGVKREEFEAAYEAWKAKALAVGIQPPERVLPHLAYSNLLVADAIIDLAEAKETEGLIRIDLRGEDRHVVLHLIGSGGEFDSWLRYNGTVAVAGVTRYGALVSRPLDEITDEQFVWNQGTGAITVGRGRQAPYAAYDSESRELQELSYLLYNDSTSTYELRTRRQEGGTWTTDYTPAYGRAARPPRVKSPLEVGGGTVSFKWDRDSEQIRLMQCEEHIIDGEQCLQVEFRVENEDQHMGWRGQLTAPLRLPDYVMPCVEPADYEDGLVKTWAETFPRLQSREPVLKLHFSGREELTA